MIFDILFQGVFFALLMCLTAMFVTAAMLLVVILFERLKK